MKPSLTMEQKRLDTDLWIIGLVSLVGFMLYMVSGNSLMKLIENTNISILVRVLVTGLFQFSIAGLGSVIVCVLRKENLSQMGLLSKGALKAVVATVLCFIPYLIYIVISGQFKGYYPLSVLLTDDVLASPMISKIIGMFIIALAWGVFEGFNYTVISRKINERYPNKRVNVGALSCAIICILIHPFSTSFWGIIEIITTFIFIYGMIAIYGRTNNSWGSILAFCLLWNAF